MIDNFVGGYLEFCVYHLLDWTYILTGRSWSELPGGCTSLVFLLAISDTVRKNAPVLAEANRDLTRGNTGVCQRSCV